MTMAKTLFVSTAILSLVAVSSCGSNPSNGDAGAGAGGKGGTTGVGGQAGTSAGGRGGGGAGATGSGGSRRRVAGNGGGAGTTAGAAVMAAAPRVLVAVLPGAAGPEASRETVLAAEAAWAVPRETPDVAAWVGGGESCGGQICGQDEFCCGPPACGNCRNILTGPNCPTSCGGAGGNAGQGGRGGQGGADCTVTGCPTGQVCYGRIRRRGHRLH